MSCFLLPIFSVYLYPKVPLHKTEIMEHFLKVVKKLNTKPIKIIRIKAEKEKVTGLYLNVFWVWQKSSICHEGRGLLPTSTSQGTT